MSDLNLKNYKINATKCDYLSINEASDFINKFLVEKFPDRKISKKIIKKIINSLDRDITNSINQDITDNMFKRHVKHSTIDIFNPFMKKKIPIDTGIARLIKYMWMCDINTTNSCENNIPENYIWIEFLSAVHLENFLKIVFKDIDCKSKIYRRANSRYSYLPTIYGQKESASVGANVWIYNMLTYDNCLLSSEQNIENQETKINEIYVLTSLRFPKSDYQWICKRFENYIKNNYKYNCILS
ncbi:hypothetical protein QLL95_gp1003 [Cotonvirus japonicus]|uniref:Uncharacterized protein n=1 Tax=Cotonvirus japonicus TaxID=2811091 RepID=A0ABM7NSI0_9VIRU|nr:hypothetical protein QLL95_gp1003 [Cotonvirus japonicus]BCS83120.1 hypothetical protein [Cotonvirus japonicus]